MLWFNLSLWFIFFKPAQFFWTSYFSQTSLFGENRGRVKKMTQENFCRNILTPFSLSLSPLISLHPPYYTLPTTPYTCRFIIFFLKPYQDLNQVLTSDLLLCNPTLYPLDHQGFVANFTHICCYYNLFGSRPPNAWLILYKKKLTGLKKMNGFQKNELVSKKKNTKNKIKP